MKYIKYFEKDDYLHAELIYDISKYCGTKVVSLCFKLIRSLDNDQK